MCSTCRNCNVLMPAYVCMETPPYNLPFWYNKVSLILSYLITHKMSFDKVESILTEARSLAVLAVPAYHATQASIQVCMAYFLHKILALMPGFARALQCTSTFKHAYTQVHTCMYACMHSILHTCIPTCMHMHTHRHTHACMHTHAGSYTHSKRDACTCTNMHQSLALDAVRRIYAVLRFFLRQNRSWCAESAFIGK